MGDCCPTVNIEGAYVQENGIIRLKDGKYIGRLDGVTFEEVVKRESAPDSTESPQPYDDLII